MLLLMTIINYHISCGSLNISCTRETGTEIYPSHRRALPSFEISSSGARGVANTRSKHNMTSASGYTQEEQISSLIVISTLTSDPCDVGVATGSFFVK